jgi:hypothetical protein
MTILKFCLNELFGGCTKIMVVKRIVAFIIILGVLMSFCMAETLGLAVLFVIMSLAIGLWRFCNITDAFPND